MQSHVPAIANEFDSYMQDRAQRLGYGVRWLSADEAYALPAEARLALVEFRASPAEHRAIPANMQAYHDRGHFVAWAEAAGALVQMNVCRKETRGGGSAAGAVSRIGVRTFAEEFFGNEQGYSLALDEFRAYLGGLAADPPADTGAAALALAVRIPEARALLLVRLPSIAAAKAWLPRNT